MTTTPPTPTLPTLPALPCTTALPAMGVIAIEGADAAAFIHNQLSHDFLLLKPNEARLAVWCTPKGRALISFYGIKPEAERVLLLLAVDSVEFIVKRLKMFVLRSKCTVRDASAEFQISGHIEAAPNEQGSDNTAMHTRVLAGGGYALTLPSVTLNSQVFLREIRVISAQAAPKVEVTPPDLMWWNWLQVHSGVALVGAAVREAFVPQMINYESIGGINFKKGCYPGQEVVARSQFRGQVKRRAYLVHAAGELAAGSEVLDAQGQACGMVAMSAPSPADASAGAGAGAAYAAIVSVQTNSAEAGGLQAGGHALALLPLPYALLDDI